MKSSKNIYLFLVVAITYLISGCNGSELYYSRSYINLYNLYDGISLRRSLNRSTKNIDLCINVTHRISSQSEGADKEFYDRICTEYGDTAYNQNIYLPNGIIYPMSDYPHIAVINVTSSEDFDEAHPAGTSLNDVMSVIYSNIMEYVESGYTCTINNSKTKSLNELQPQDLAMSDGQLSLAFNKEPDELCIHTLTVECTTHTGEVMTAQISYDFRLPEGFIGDYDNL